MEDLSNNGPSEADMMTMTISKKSNCYLYSILSACYKILFNYPRNDFKKMLPR